MLQSINELQQNIPLTVLHGPPEKLIPTIIKQLDIQAIYYMEDYTPYAIKRDLHIKNLVSVPIIQLPDAVLHAPTMYKAYKVFTPYYDLVRKKLIDKPSNFTSSMLSRCKKLPSIKGYLTVNHAGMINKIKAIIKRDTTLDLNLVQHGGRSLGIKLLNKFSLVCNRYSKTRDNLLDGTSRLSAHLKFGTLSIREVYYACLSREFRRQLYWRDFYLQVAYYFPEVFKGNYRYHIKWKYNKKHYLAWCNGKTGYNLVDAFMTELNTTGYMPNRGRMLVASFLTKILHLNWRLGEVYFASKLTDYDPANNNGGWQWCAGTGVDAQPYFRIFNPIAQEKKYDPDGEYVAKWLPGRAKNPIKPIVDYETERKVALTLFHK
jgi:deoxyribodipyrimidine photo-lyase